LRELSYRTLTAGWNVAGEGGWNVMARRARVAGRVVLRKRPAV